MKLLTRSITILLALLLAGCATTWARIDDADRNYQHAQYRATLPAGWLRLESDDSLILSRDGILVQHIGIQFKTHAEAFEKIKKTSSPSMLPSELAALAIAEFKATQEEGLPSLEILHNRPVEMAGRTGFDLHLRYKTDTGLNMDMLLRGIVAESGYYLVEFSAPSLHYFQRDRQHFESFAASLQVKDQAKDG